MNNYTAGTSIGGYTLDILIGKGAAGEVWKAHDSEKDVAVKFMNLNLMESEAADKHRRRMAREVSILRLLKHPNIPTLYDANSEFVPPYLVMTYVTGDTYDKLLASGAMIQIPLPQRLESITALASALDTAHAADIIHRDIKPSNMIGIEHPYLIDFGLAIKKVNLKESMREVGTLLYMTPDDLAADASSDSYAFAVTVYELLFGGHPIFRAEDNTLGASLYLRTLAGERIAKGEWHIPSRIPVSEIPYDLRQSDLTRLDKVFGKAFGNSENRYVDMLTFVAELKEAITLPEGTVINQPVNSITEDMPTQLEASAPPAANPSTFFQTAPESRIEAPIPHETPVAPYTAPQRAPDRFTVIEVEKKQAPPQGSRQNIYLIAGAVVIVVVVIVILLATHTV